MHIRHRQVFTTYNLQEGLHLVYIILLSVAGVLAIIGRPAFAIVVVPIYMAAGICELLFLRCPRCGFPTYNKKQELFTGKPRVEKTICANCGWDLRIKYPDGEKDGPPKDE
jgi:hypothetical protein